MKKYGYVYHTYCAKTKCHYVGQRKGKQFDRVYLGSGLILHCAILKYGEDAFEVTPIKWCSSQEELNIEEIWQIARFRKQYPKKMYNILNGGHGGTGPGVPEKISKALRGRKKSDAHKAALKQSWNANYKARCVQNKRMWILRKQRYGPSGGNKSPTPDEQRRRTASIRRTFANNPEAVKDRIVKVWSTRYKKYGDTGGNISQQASHNTERYRRIMKNAWELRKQKFGPSGKPV